MGYRDDRRAERLNFHGRLPRYDVSATGDSR